MRPLQIGGFPGGRSPSSRSTHFDSTREWHHDDGVRTTVTLDKDVERMLREAMHRSRPSFKVILNEALRAGLSGELPQEKAIPFVVKSRSLGLKAGLDPAALQQANEGNEELAPGKLLPLFFLRALRLLLLKAAG